MIRFCYYCGEGYNKNNDIDYFTCSCGAQFIPPVTVKESQITLEEAEANFNKIPLTDSQRGVKKRKK